MAADWQQALSQDAALSAQHRLWVPMLMEVLVYGSEGSTSFIDLTPRYEGLLDPEEAPLGVKLKPTLDGDSPSPAFLDPGIHLHWSLPAAFTHVRPTPHQAGEPPKASTWRRVPNRWLVCRVWESGDGVLSQKSWLVESDYRDPGEGVTPWLEGNGKAYRVTRLGKGEALETWTEARTQAPFLSAFAPGNLAFAAFYPSCRSVFGFHDDAADLPAGTVCSYLVAGWFSDETADPLDVGTKDEWLARMRELEWAVPEDTRFLPTGVTCYAVMPGVEWTPDAPCDDPSSPPVEVALGSGFVEAVAALSKDTGAGDFGALAAQLRNQLQLAALASRRPTRSDLQRPDLLFKEIGRLAGLRARLHERAFLAQPGGTVWEIVRHTGADPAGKDTAEPIVVLPDAIAEKLRAVNESQRRFDEAARELAGARRRLFAAWYQHQYWTTRAGMTDAERQALGQVLSARLGDARKAVERLEKDPNARGDSLAQRRKSLEDALQNDLRDHTLVARAMPRFWRATDPSVLLSGVPMPEVQGGRSPLLCRVSHQTVVQLRIEQAATFGTIAISRDDLRRKAQGLLSALAKVPGDVPELLLDLLFADRGAAGLLARIYWEPRYGNPSADQISAVRNEIEQAQAGIEDGASRLKQGQSPAQALSIDCDGERATLSFLAAFNHPAATACPVFMLWQAKWHPYYRSPAAPPATAPSPQQQLATAWTFDPDGVDHVWSSTESPQAGEPTIYDGFSVVATRLERGLAATRQKFPAHAPVFRRLQNIAGQSLNGLTEALGMVDVGPQLPPLKGPGALQADVEMNNLVGDEYAAAPLVTLPPDLSHFFPVRGGHLQLTRLWLVDTFGRIRRVIETIDDDHPVDPDIRLGSSLGSGIRNLARVAPRLVQPARLLFRWASAIEDRQESLGDLQTSPICGFVVHNRLDRSIVIHGADGRVFGAVQAVRRADGQETARWATLPLQPHAGATEVTAADIPNRHLRGFVNGLLGMMGGSAGLAFQDFRNLLDRIEEASDQGREHGPQSVLAGRPLALVRASVRLETDGPPLTDQGLPSLETANAADLTPAFTRMTFPVRLGDRRLGADGLVGYFVDDGSASVYAKLRLSGEQKPEGAVHPHTYFDYGRVVDLACARPDEPAAMLTLLLDPKLGVHIVSAILPTNVVTLPLPLVSAAMSELELRFLVAPIVGERDLDPKVRAAPSMPLPSNGHAEWAWVSFAGPGSTAADEVPMPADTGPGAPLFAPLALHEGWLKYCRRKDKAGD